MRYFSIKDTVLSLEEVENTRFDIVSNVKNYSVQIQDEDIEKMIHREYSNGNIVVLDKNVFEIYSKSMRVINPDDTFIIDAQEENKTIETALNLISFLSQKNFHKKNNMVVIGGGITQDIGSFVGACFKRGIDWTFIPTTLLAQCDSCIGSKSGLNYNEIKNQIGLFSPPKRIAVNPNFLKTLAPEEIKSGLGEILKVYLMAGNNLFDFYSQRVKKGEIESFSSWGELILKSLLIKKQIIENDELERDIRRALNYGHTVGHAIETLTNYQIPHGQAVALGVYVSNTINKTISDEVGEEILTLVTNKDILKKIDYDKMKLVLMRDKKSIGEDIMMVFVDPSSGSSRLDYVNVNILVEKIKNVIDHIL